MPKKLSLGHRGAAIVTVLISMLFVTALGSALLFLSYTSYNMKQTERTGKQTFYNAETAMNEVRSGLQAVVTSAIASAYTDVLVEYNNSAVNTDKAFHQKFIDALMTWESTEKKCLFQVVQDGYSFNPDVLKEFINVSESENVTFSCPSGGVVLTTKNSEKEITDLTLKSVQVSYHAKGFESTVSSDLTISMPAFEYARSEYSLYGVPEFAIIADDGLRQAGTGATAFQINGNAYAGTVLLDKGNAPLTIKNGMLICGGQPDTEKHSGLVSVQGITTANQSRLVIDETATLWANRITVGGGSSIALNGDAYIADDLELAGNNTVANLAGHYYGFGLSNPNDLNAKGESASSSSILINGSHPTLDLSGLKHLMLAGNSYISEGDANLIMGQSISVKSDQLAYLIPKNCLTIPNPSLYGQEKPKYDVAYTTPIWTIDGVPKTLGSYGIKVQEFHQTMSNGQNVLYLFMQFNTRANANAYFRDYFSQNETSLNDYLNQYVTLKTSTQTVRTAGNTYQKDPNTQTFDLASALSDFNTMELSAKRLADMYQNLCVTLSANQSAKASSAKSPYEFVVNTAALNTLPQGITQFVKESGQEVLALIVNGDITISKDIDPDVRLILCSGNITVESDFSGLLIADGIITLNANLSSNRAAVVGALSASVKGGGDNAKHLIEFLNLGTTVSGNNAQGVQSWEPAGLVTYKNWKKS